MERWQDIPRYEDRYRVSDLGRVFNIKKNRIKEPRITANGYRSIRLPLDLTGERYHWKISRLVFAMFKGELRAGMVIDHKDENKLNDQVGNLQQITHRENVSRSIHREGYVGVRVAPSGKYKARAKFRGKSYYLGTFFHPKSAHRARLRAIKLFNETGNVPQ